MLKQNLSSQDCSSPHIWLHWTCKVSRLSILSGTLDSHSVFSLPPVPLEHELSKNKHSERKHENAVTVVAKSTWIKECCRVKEVDSDRLLAISHTPSLSFYNLLCDAGERKLWSVRPRLLCQLTSQYIPSVGATKRKLEGGKKEGLSFCFSSPVSTSYEQKTAMVSSSSFLWNSWQQQNAWPPSEV